LTGVNLMLLSPDEIEEKANRDEAWSTIVQAF
jgi:hypothetical protein